LLPATATQKRYLPLTDFAPPLSNPLSQSIANISLSFPTAKKSP
jgi:hypothetical protein